MKNFTLLLLAVSALTLMSCNVDDTQNINSPDWQLTWSDDFDGPAGSPPDTVNNWNFDIGFGDNGWGNQELQNYTSDAANAQLDGEGNLVITATSSPFTSARINTKDKFEQAYGRFEARLKTPYGPGIWPAFWLLGENIDEVGWPQTGEIDVMELRGQQPSIIAGSLHGPGYSGGEAISKLYGLQEGRFDTEFYVFAVEWYPNRIDFFVNDFLYSRINRNDVEKEGEWVYDKPFFIILNVAVGGNYVGFPTPDTPFPQSMIIDYVRVYQEAN